MILYYILGGVLLVVIVLWQMDKASYEAKLSVGSLRKEQLDELEKQLTKERGDAEKELNMIQSRLILFMQLENDIIQKEQQSSEEMKKRSDNLGEIMRKLEGEREFWKENLMQQVAHIQTIASDKSVGFPWLAKAYADFFYLQDSKLAEHLEKAPGVELEFMARFREIIEKRRTAEEKFKLVQYLFEYYECLFPWLPEFKREHIEDVYLQTNWISLADGAIDPLFFWVSDEESRTHDSAGKMQLALNRFWEKNQSKWELSRKMEKYVFYLLFKDGWKLKTLSFLKGYPEFAKNIIAQKDGKTLFIQCRFFQKDLIVERHLYQLLNSAMDHFFELFPDAKTNPKLGNFTALIEHYGYQSVFYSDGILLESAKKVSRMFGLEVHENFKFEPFPAIKCSVSEKDGKKFFLPFDQFYDMVPRQDETLECYVKTVAEAISKGFKRDVILPGVAPE